MREINLTQTYERSAGLLRRIEASTGQKPEKCNQCAKCSGGCPLAFYMDFPPNMIMRLLQIGMINEVLNSSALWICSSCATCTTRCPQDIDVAAIMDALRVIGRKKGMTARGKSVLLFHNLFLESVKDNGRLYQLGLALKMNLRSGKLLKDARFGLPLVVRGKLKLFPRKIQGREQIQKIFEISRQREEDF